MKTIIKKIILKGNEISYNLTIKKVKNINLRIKSDKTVNVSANTRVSQKVIDEFLISKADYILKALKYYGDAERKITPSAAYKDGDIITVFGENRVLTVTESQKNYAELSDGHIKLFVKSTDDFELKERTLYKLLNQLCRDAVLTFCEEVYPRFKEYGVEFPEIKFRKMVSMWGNCRPKRGILTFNIALAHVSFECIRYVVIHEFVHFLEPNHSAEFYNKLSEFMPNWKVCREKLKSKNIKVN